MKGISHTEAASLKRAHKECMHSLQVELKDTLEGFSQHMLLVLSYILCMVVIAPHYLPQENVLCRSCPREFFYRIP